MKQVMFRLATVGLALAGLAAAGEGALALYHEWLWRSEKRALPPVAERCLVPSDDPVLLFEFNPGWSDGTFTVNTWGMADREVALHKEPGTLRLAFAGDSITANFGLTPRPQIYLNVLERTLDERDDLAADIEVLNFGVNGYGILQTARVVTTRVDPFEPDVVIVQLCLNDSYTSGMAGLVRAELPGSRLRAFFARRADPVGFYADLLVASGFDETGRSHMEQGLRSIAEHARTTSVPVLLVLFPYLHSRAYEERGFERFHVLVAEIAAQNGLPLLDLHPAFVEAGLLERPGRDPLHPDPAGHRVAAAEIERALEREGWLQLTRK